MDERERVATRLRELVDEVYDIHLDRRDRYGFPDDPLYNLKSADEWSVAPWIGAAIREQDKTRRLQNFARRSLAGEALSTEDVRKAKSDLVERALYLLLMVILFEDSYPVDIPQSPVSTAQGTSRIWATTWSGMSEQLQLQYK